jgi:hypothetical protein
MNVGEMQRKLSRWAEQDQSHEFFDLYHLLYDRDWLRLAHDHVKENAGSKRSPAASGGAFAPCHRASLFEEVELFSLRCTVMRDIFSDHIRRHWVSNCAHEVPIFPEFPAPQLLPDLGILAKHRPRTQTLEPRDDLRDRVAWGERAQDMDVIFTDFHFLDRHFVMLGDLTEPFRHLAAQLPTQDFLAVFRRPDQVVLGIVDGVGGSPDDHAAILTKACQLGSGH